jgi:hypothetical protein
LQWSLDQHIMMSSDRLSSANLITSDDVSVDHDTILLSGCKSTGSRFIQALGFICY